MSVIISNDEPSNSVINTALSRVEKAKANKVNPKNVVKSLMKHTTYFFDNRDWINLYEYYT